MALLYYFNLLKQTGLPTKILYLGQKLTKNLQNRLKFKLQPITEK